MWVKENVFHYKGHGVNFLTNFFHYEAGYGKYFPVKGGLWQIFSSKIVGVVKGPQTQSLANS